jgi:opacity protein-like surface antigen
MKKLGSLLALIFMCTMSAFAQDSDVEKSIKPFRNLDLSVTAGTSGIGFDLATKINSYVGLRAGFSYMPQLEPKINFGIEGGRYDFDGNWVTTRFDNMASQLQEFTGLNIDTSVDMVGEPNFYNFNLLVDVFPFENKKWHITAGVYYGPSSVAKAKNSMEDMPSPLGVSIYNNMYNKIINGEPIIGEDGYLAPELEDKFWDMGRMGIRIGEYKRDVLDAEGNVVHQKGEPYMMEPDANSMVRATVKVNRIKPFLGFGYEGALFKKDPSYKISFDCGVLFWGGKPQLITHDGTDSINDLDNVRGKVGDYVDAIKKFEVYPMLNIRITKTIF